MMLLQTCEFQLFGGSNATNVYSIWKLLNYYTISNNNVWINTMSVKSLAYNGFSFGHVKFSLSPLPSPYVLTNQNVCFGICCKGIVNVTFDEFCNKKQTCKSKCNKQIEIKLVMFITCAILMDQTLGTSCQPIIMNSCIHYFSLNVQQRGSLQGIFKLRCTTKDVIMVKF